MAMIDLVGPGRYAATTLGPGGKSPAAWATDVPSATRARAVAARSLVAEMRGSLRFVPGAGTGGQWTPGASSIPARRAGEPARRSRGTRPPDPVGCPPPRPDGLGRFPAEAGRLGPRRQRAGRQAA